MTVCACSRSAGGAAPPAGGDAAASSGPAADAAGESAPGPSSSPLPDPEELLLKVSSLHAEVSELKNDRLRLLADMENVRNIARRDVDNAKAYAVQSFAKQLLGVVDTLSLAVSSVPAGSVDSNEALKTLYEGVSMTHHSLLKALSGQGVVQFGAAGDKYDPHLHEAMFEAEHETLAPGTVSSVLVTGFKLKDRVLRPAKVGTVKRKPE
jgi:molecular chaperone GrpE